MSKKLVIAVAPLVAFAALATTPVTAQAALCKKFTVGAIPHYCKNGVKLEEYPTVATEKTPVIQWTHFSFGASPGVQCRNAVAGNVWNPEGGGAGQGETIAFTNYECSLAACPLETKVIAENLPWPSVAFESGAPDPAGTIRVKTSGMRLNVGCYFPNPYPPAEGEKGQLAQAPSLFGGPGTPGNGELKGSFKLGSSGCNKPSQTIFEKAGAGSAGSGELEEEVGGEGSSSAPGPIKGSEPGAGTGVKALLEGTVKTCGFANSETINIET